MRNTKTLVDKEELARLRAAEDVCWCLAMMINLGGLSLPQGERDFLFKPLIKWTDQAVKTGIMASGEEQ